MADNTYNGWSNRNTWVVNLHWGDYWAQLVEDGETVTAETMENDVEEFIDAAFDDMSESHRLFIGDFLSLSDVNWNELADHYMREEA